MFPRHVRWYRLLLLLLVVVNCDEAIAKTEDNLNLDSGPGIIVTCPAASTGSSACGGVAPPMQPSFMNQISDGDIAAFGLIGGSITGTPCGDIIILGLDVGSGTTPEGCDFITRQFIIYDDANSDGQLESSEFIQNCTVQYIIGDNQAPDVDFSFGLNLDCFSFDIESELNLWLESGAESFVIDCSNVTVTNDYDGGIDFCTTGQYPVNFTFTDECGNETIITESIFFFHEVFFDCSPSIFVDCFNPEFLRPANSLTEFNFMGGFVELCSDNITITHVDGPGAITDICDAPLNEFYFFNRTYFFTDNDCGITYECNQSIDIFRTEPTLFFSDNDCPFSLPPSSPISGKEIIEYGVFPDGGCGELTITFTDSPHDCNEAFVRTYTATDECGGFATYNQSYFADDAFTVTCPTNFTIFDCVDTYQSSGNITPMEFANYGTIGDYCGTLTIEYTDTPSNLTPCDYGIPISREFTFTTDCGTVETCISVFTFENFAPFAFCPFTSSLPIQFEGELPEPYTTIEEMICDGGDFNGKCSEVTIISVIDDPPVPDFYANVDFTQTVVRTYTFENACGQTTQCNQFIEYFTGPAPASVLNCDAATNIEVDCNDSDPAGPTINDLVAGELALCADALEAANPGSTAVSNFAGITYSGSGTMQDVIFTLSDGSGNTLDCPKTITLIGDCPIGVDCSAATDIVVNCNDADPPATPINDLIAEEVDNCNAALEAASTSPDGGPVTVTNNYLFLTYSGSGSTQDIIFTVTDNEGTETECPKSITIVGDCKFVTCPPTPFLTCEEGVPPPVTSFKAFMDMGGQYDFLGCDTVSITSSLDDDFEDLNFCSTDKIELRRLYTLTDGCGQIFRCRQKIRYFRYTDGPELTCPPDITVDVNTADCSYMATLTPPVATSACSNVEVVSVTSQFANNEVNLPEGDHVIMWTARNECGRTTTCEQTITVVGTGNDFAIICEGSKMAFLEANGFANVPAEQFVNTIYDACGSSGPYVYQIRRLNAGPCSNGTGSVYAPSISVCCDDLLANTFDVSIRVTDNNGNQAICTAEVQVKDLIAPTITSCPADRDVSCSQIIDLSDLNQYGFPTATDNCPGGLLIIETVEDLREDCGLGEIIRTFTIKDLANNIVTCSQTLNVFNDDPLEEDDIVWPDDITFTNLCNFEIPGSDVAGIPTYPINLCSQPLLSESDEVLISGPGCLVVSRKFVVIDWCQFENGADPSTYRWEYTQIITLVNTIAPVFDECESFVETCGNELTCTGMINLTMTATDDCATADELKYAYTLTLESGAVINGQGNSINAPYPYGEHNLVWSVTDGCGNFTTCVQSVHIKDCKPPNAICLSGININLTQMPGANPMVEIWAKDLDASTTDNCTATEDLEFAFDINFTQPVLIFDCSDAGSSQLVRMYVRDSDGNVGFCKAMIGIQDNHNLCTNIVTNEDEVMIAGRIATEANLTMEEVDVKLENSSTPMHYMTDQNGLYAFENLPMYDDFNLIPTFEDEILNGVSTADILLIQRHILDIDRLDSPYKIIAADVNNSENITGVDIIELRKIILGLKDEFSNSTVWRFVDPTTGMTDPENPFPYSENMSLIDLDYNAYNMDFVGVKTGDVNYSALINGFIPETNFSTRSYETLRLISNSVERGSVRFTVNNDQLLTGFQLAFRISGPIDQFNLNSSIIDIDESNYAIHDDVVKISWSSGEAINFTEGTELFSINLDEDADYELLTDLPMFETEAYNADIRSMDIEINLEDNLVDDEWQVFRNTPNPFVDNTFIPFTAPRESQLKLSVFDVNGKLLFQQSRLVAEGYQKWELSATDLGNVHGVLYYRLESGAFSSTQPFIRLK